MLDVKDGDAIIVELIKPGKSLIMVIDGGDPGYYITKVKPKLQEVLVAHGKDAPDIVVCTHYDSDHIGGLIPLIKDYINNIQEVWFHLPPKVLNEYIQESVHLLEERGKLEEREKFVGDFEHSKFQNLFKGFQIETKSLLDSKANLILESLSELQLFVKLIPEDKINQVFYNQRPLPDWPEIQVLGPTRTYFNRLFPPAKEFDDFIKEEVFELIPDGRVDMRILEMAGIHPCDQLKKDHQTRLSTTNKASIIISIDTINGRYLFTGDAGIESFKAIPEWQTELHNLYFLKIPHHASNNNMSQELIEIMQPIYAYNSGFDFQDDAVLQCIASKDRNIRVRTTKNLGDLMFNE